VPGFSLLVWPQVGHGSREVVGRCVTHLLVDQSLLEAHGQPRSPKVGVYSQNGEVYSQEVEEDHERLSQKRAREGLEYRHTKHTCTVTFRKVHTCVSQN